MAQADDLTTLKDVVDYPSVPARVTDVVDRWRDGDQTSDSAEQVIDVVDIDPTHLGRAIEIHLPEARVGIRLGRYEAESIQGSIRVRLYSDVVGGQVSYVVPEGTKVVVFG
jgi:dihydroneopterin aldolase